MPCLVGEECPEKGNPNFNTCKHSEYNCPYSCARKDEGCDDTSDNIEDKCCRSLKCDGEKCVPDSCKESGDCSSDDECCDDYGCHNNSTVIWARGQKCTQIQIVFTILNAIHF